MPAHTGVAAWPYELVGAGFGLLGIAFLWFGYARNRAVEAALDRGTFAPLGVVAPAVLFGAGLVLGGAVISLVLLT